jgi:hypothetical protein
MIFIINELYKNEVLIVLDVLMVLLSAPVLLANHFAHTSWNHLYNPYKSLNFKAINQPKQTLLKGKISRSKKSSCCLGEAPKVIL